MSGLRVNCATVAILHAFSYRNAGDALLLDLTLERLQRAGIAPHRCRLVALDPRSFELQASGLESVRGSPGEPWGRLSTRLLPATMNLAGTLASLPSPGRLALSTDARALEGISAVVGIGGGYLKADRCRASAGLVLNHLPSLLLATRMDMPSIYLPQSVGPLRGPVGALTRRLLSHLDHLFVRDAESAKELDGANVTRMPDLAVLHLGERWSSGHSISARRANGPPVLVPRPLPHPTAYETRLAELARRLGDPLFAVQAAGPEGRTDETIIHRLHARSAGRLTDLLNTGHSGVVVSVRLHGALQALLAGRPAIHLSYDRKGPAAFEALGLQRFVHDAWTFSPATVHQQLDRLRADPDEQWTRVSSRVPELKRLSIQLQQRVNEVLAPAV